MSNLPKNGQLTLKLAKA